MPIYIRYVLAALLFGTTIDIVSNASWWKQIIATTCGLIAMIIVGDMEDE